MRKKTLVGLLLLVIVGTLSGAGYTGAAAQLRTADERGSRIYWSQFVDLNFSASRIVVHSGTPSRCRRSFAIRQGKTPTWIRSATNPRSSN